MRKFLYENVYLAEVAHCEYTEISIIVLLRYNYYFSCIGSPETIKYAAFAFFATY